MNNRLQPVMLAVFAAILALAITACKKEAPTSQMLMDDEVKVTIEDKALADSSKPQPLPAEPYPSMKAGEMESSTMLIDREEFEQKVGFPYSKKEARPVPFPEEPKTTDTIRK